MSGGVVICTCNLLKCSVFAQKREMPGEEAKRFDGSTGGSGRLGLVE